MYSPGAAPAAYPPFPQPLRPGHGPGAGQADGGLVRPADGMACRSFGLVAMEDVLFRFIYVEYYGAFFFGIREFSFGVFSVFVSAFLVFQIYF